MIEEGDPVLDPQSSIELRVDADQAREGVEEAARYPLGLSQEGPGPLRPDDERQLLALHDGGGDATGHLPIHHVGDPDPGQMRMALDQPWGHQVTGQVDTLRPLPGPGCNLRVRADEGHSTVRDGDAPAFLDL